MRKASKLLRSLFVLASFLFLWSVTGCPHPIESEPTNVTVTFESNGGSAVEPITIEKGNSIEKPADPIKNGYVFSGWYIGTSKIEFPYTPEDNVTLQAAWNLEVYSIEYVLSELATNDPSNPTEYTIESEEIKVEDLKAPALKTGAKFLGWFVDEEFKTDFVSIKTGSTGNVKIYGRITVGPTYTVTYYLPEDATAKTKVVAENDVFTLTGYDFYTDKDLKNPYNGAKITSDITLYAKAKMFKVTFDPANGSAPTVVECEYNKAVKVPSEEPTPIDNKTFFAGWYLGDKLYDFEKPITGDIKLTAKWNKPFEKVSQLNYMPVISITANYLATSDEEDKYKEKNVNDFVKLPVAKSVKEQEKDWNGTAYANAPVPFYKESTISVLDENGNIALREATGKVKVRGNWTTTYKKKPLRIKFDEKQSMLGLNDGNKFKNWVLLASFKDRSFLRDITGFTLGKELSQNYYTSDFKLVEVYVNDEYFGVYILAEQQEVKDERINIDDAEKNSSNETGYLIEYDRYYEFEDAETVFELEHGSEVKDRNGEIVSEFNIESNKDSAGYTIKNDLNTPAQRDYIKNYMQTLWDKCYEAVNDSTKSEGEIKAVIEEYIDVQSLVDTYLLQEIVCDPDLYITSFFMTLDMSATGNKKLTFQAPWDFDSTMGNKKHDANEQGLYAGVVGYDVNHQRRGTGNPWMMLLVNQSWFNDMVKTKWNDVKADLALTISTQISDLTSKYTTNFENNYKKWPMEPNDEYRPEAAVCNTQSAAASQLGSWLTSRSETLEKGINNFKEKDFSKYESEYITAESTEKGIKIIFTLKDGEDFNYDWSGIKETSTQLKYNFVKQDDRSFEFYFPFVEKDTFYEFTFDGEIIKNKVPNYYVPGFSIKSKYEYIPLDVSVLQDFNKSITECNIQKNDSGALSYSLITTNTRSENVATMCSQKIGEKGSCSEEICGVWGDSSWNNTSYGWGNRVQDLTGAVTRNYVARDTYQVSVKFAINVDGNTWKTKEIWSDSYEFDLWKGIIYENEKDREPKTAWFNIYLFDDSDVYGILAWGSNAGSSNPQCLDGLLGNYERNENEIILYDPYDSEHTFVFTINGDVMTSEDPLFSGVEFKKL